jgi:stage II sporulation protein D
MSARLLAITGVFALALSGAAAAQVAHDGGGRPELGLSARAEVTTGATFVIRGHGWGHGIGMSQYGALGYARRGFTYDRILAHYYPGTQLGPTPVAKVRVLLAAARQRVTISSASPFKVKDALGERHKLAAGDHSFGPGLRLKLNETDILQKPLVGPLVFIAGNSPLEFDRPYRGQLQVVSANNKLQVINLVGLEGYLNGVVPSEMPYYWPPEALKAQAVVARSYALATRRSGAFDLYSDTRSQVYRGIDAERLPTNAAVAATAGRVVLYGGQVAHTYFFSTSGGKTASVLDVWPTAKPLPYLVSVEDPFDSVSPYHDWGPYTFTPVTLGRRLKVPGRLLDLRTQAGISGRVKLVTAIGTLGQKAIPGSDVRRTLGLRSTWFGIGVLSLAGPIAPAVYGSEVTLSGVARGLSGVEVQQRAGSSGWAFQASVAPAKDGSFSLGVRPKQTTFYRLVANEVTGGVVRARVAPVVRFYPVESQTSLRGLARPVLPGARVEIQRLDISAAAWTKVATTTIDSKGSFEARFPLTDGEYRARVIPGRGYVPGTSAVLQVLTQ